MNGVSNPNANKNQPTMERRLVVNVIEFVSVIVLQAQQGMKTCLIASFVTMMAILSFGL